MNPSGFLIIVMKFVGFGLNQEKIIGFLENLVSESFCFL